MSRRGWRALLFGLGFLLALLALAVARHEGVGAGEPAEAADAEAGARVAVEGTVLARDPVCADTDRALGRDVACFILSEPGDPRTFLFVAAEEEPPALFATTVVRGEVVSVTDIAVEARLAWDDGTWESKWARNHASSTTYPFVTITADEIAVPWFG